MEKEAFMINNKSITELRVVDLKKELEKRKLSKSGSKTELIKRLKNDIINQRSQSTSNENENAIDKPKNAGEDGNDFVKQYLEKQQRTYKEMCNEKVKIDDKKPLSEENITDTDGEATKPIENAAADKKEKSLMESQDLSESKRLENNDDENKSLPPAVHEELEAISTEEAIDKTPEVTATKQLDEEVKKFDRNCSNEVSDMRECNKGAMEESEKEVNSKTEENALISNSASQIKDTHEDFKPSSPSKSSEEDQMKDIAANSNQDDQSNKEETTDQPETEDQIDQDEISMEVNSESLEPRLNQENSPSENSNVDDKRDGQPIKRKLISPPSTEINEKKRVITTTRQAVKSDLDDSLKPQRERSASPPHQPISRAILVRNLVRPFTVGQLKSVLNKNHPIIEDLFWIDSIKSYCYAVYNSEEAAMEIRNFLDNSKWPSSNPKLLKVDFASEQEVYNHIVVDKPEATKLLKVDQSKLVERRHRRDTKEADRDVRGERIASDRDGQREEKKNKNREMERSRRDHGRDWNRDKPRRSPPRNEKRSRSPRKRERENCYEKFHDNAPAKLLDDLFHKTQAAPAIYWLPLTDEGARLRDETRRREKELREQRRQEREQEEKQKRRKELYESEPKHRYEEHSRRRRDKSESD